MDISKENESKIQQLQTIEQNLNQFLQQKQQLQAQQLEVESGMKELEDTKQAYKIVGNIMVAMDKDKLKAELEDKKKIVDMKLSTIEKQEGSLREKAKTIQEDIMQSVNKKKDSERKKDEKQ